jgi:hypothetical protein
MLPGIVTDWLLERRRRVCKLLILNEAFVALHPTLGVLLKECGFA